MECNIKLPNNSQINEPETEPSNTETRVNITKKKGHIDQEIKEVCKQYHQKHLHSKIPIPEKDIIPTTLETEIYTTASSPSNPPPVITPNTKLQIHKWPRNTFLTTGDSVISDIDDKGLSKKHLLNVRPFTGASAEDMHHYLRPLLQKCPDTTVLHVGTNNLVNKFFRVVLDKILSLKTFMMMVRCLLQWKT